MSDQAGTPASGKKEWPVSGAALLTAARAGYGAMLLAAPRSLTGIVAPEPPSARAVAVIRVLGARHLVQAALTAAVLSGTLAPARAMPPEAMLAGAVVAKAILAKAAPDGTQPRTVLLAGAAVDSLHAASMVALALAAGRVRRGALADAALEAGFASFGIITARRQPHP